MYASRCGRPDLGAFIDLLCCPATGEPLSQTAGGLVNRSGTRAYPINASGVPLFAVDLCTAEARIQQAHYDRIAAAYVVNLGYPHTQEYMAYLDRALDAAVGAGDLGITAELCCGHGEALPLLSGRITRYVGIDVSEKMLDAAAGMQTITRCCLPRATQRCCRSPMDASTALSSLAVFITYRIAGGCSARFSVC